MMRQTLTKTVAMVALAALSTASAMMVGGCKRPSEMADLAVTSDVEKGQAELLKQPDASTALPVYSKALGNKSSSPQSQALANLAAGDAEVLAADSAIQRVDDRQLRLARLLGRTAQLASQVQANNVRIAGLTAREPKATLAALDKTTTAARAGDNGNWIAGDAAAVPALATVEKSSTDLQQQIDALKAKHEDLAKQRTAALTKAEQLSRQSESAKGQASVDLYTQGANQRKAASDLATQIDDNEAQTAALTRELNIARQEQTQLQSAVAKFGDQSKQVGAGWADVQKQIEAITARSKEIVDGGGDAAAASSAPAANAPATQPVAVELPPSVAGIDSIAAAGEQIAQLNDELKKLRDEAGGHLQKATGYYDALESINKQLNATYKRMSSSPEARQSSQHFAWDWMAELHNVSEPNVLRGLVQQRAARLSADEAYFLQQRLNTSNALKSVLDPAKLQVPKSFDPAELEPQVTAARTNAAGAFDKAEKYLDDAMGAGGNETDKALAQSARVARMVEQYGRWAFAKSIGSPEADRFLTSSKQMVSELVADNVQLPTPLPPEIAPAPAAATAAASTPAASTQPATAPAAGAATQPAGPGAAANPFEATPAAPAPTPPAVPPATPPAEPAPTAAPTTTPAAPAPGTGADAPATPPADAGAAAPKPDAAPPAGTDAK